MRKLLSGLFYLLLIAAYAQPKTPSGVTLRLSLQSEDGTNGCAVAWNPEKKLYYTIIAGNVEFPMDIFDANGQWLSTHLSGVDNRGLWFNTKTGKLQARSFDGQLFDYALKSNGNPNAPIQVKENVGPSDQNIGTFAKGTVYYYSDGVVNVVPSKGKPKAIQLAMPSDYESYNHYSMGATGVKNFEFVVWNVATGSLEFYNLKGKQTGTVKLPGEVPLAENFRFSFANNHAWLYDVDSRTWSGYKIF